MKITIIFRTDEGKQIGKTILHSARVIRTSDSTDGESGIEIKGFSKKTFLTKWPWSLAR